MIRVAVVTGAAGGVGRACVTAFVEAGWEVACIDRIDRPAWMPGRWYAQLDLGVRFAAERLRAFFDEVGQIDALVNNAAIGHIRLVEDGRTAEWRAQIETNLLGTMIACRAALRHMLPRGAGDIVNMTSASAHEAWPYLAAYSASKAAIDTFSRALRAEVAPRGLRVMTVEIHNVASEFGTNFDPTVLPTALQRWKETGLVNPETPLLAPEDVARAVAFQLAQPERASIHSLEIRSRAN
jgi:NAD(P)-dependent dehydrogenase (short-subunit alcohol dehydrogenase family)